MFKKVILGTVAAVLAISGTAFGLAFANSGGDSSTEQASWCWSCFSIAPPPPETK